MVSDALCDNLSSLLRAFERPADGAVDLLQYLRAYFVQRYDLDLFLHHPSVRPLQSACNYGIFNKKIRYHLL